MPGSFIHGKNAVFKIATNTAPTTVTDISQYLDSVSYPRTTATAETTTFGAGARTYVTTFPGNTFDITGKWDGTAGAIDAILVGLQGLSNSVALEFDPGGTATGMPKYTLAGNASGTTNPGVFLTNFQVTSPVNDVVSFSATFTIASGNVTRGAN